MTVLSTTDYSIFKLNESNRSVKQKFVETLKKSISDNNLLRFRPIVVDTYMNVLDGQHRLEAAKQLKIPIYYQIQPQLGIKDIIAINTQLNWRMEDFFNFFCKEAYPEYLKLKKFMDTYHYTLSEGLAILNLSPKNGSGLHNSIFKQGKFVFPSDEIPEIQEKIESIEKIKSYLKRHSKTMKLHVTQPLFIKALIAFFACRSMDPEIFFKKLQYNLDLMRPCRTLALYVELFRDIYNWKNKNPL
jgi:hypothetical protein